MIPLMSQLCSVVFSLQKVVSKIKPGDPKGPSRRDPLLNIVIDFICFVFISIFLSALMLHAHSAQLFIFVYSEFFFTTAPEMQKTPRFLWMQDFI